MTTSTGTPAAEEVEEFLAKLGHDLRNPLNALMAALGVLDLFPPGSAQAEEARQVIARQAERMRGLIDARLTPPG
jgi:signal transduction histidine kinase